MRGKKDKILRVRKGKVVSVETGRKRIGMERDFRKRKGFGQVGRPAP